MISADPGWVQRIHARIAQEAAVPPSRRFVVAVGALAPGQALAALRQSVGAAFGRGRFPAVVRAQALGLVLLVGMSVGVLGAGGVVVVGSFVSPPDQPTHRLPATGETAAPSSQPRPQTGLPGVVVVDATPRVRSDEPPSLDGPVPSPTPALGSDVSNPPDALSAGPDRPPTTHPTPKPHPTPRADKTPKPHPTPKADKTPKPHPTPRAHPTPSSPRTPRAATEAGPDPAAR